MDPIAQQIIAGFGGIAIMICAIAFFISKCK